MRVIFVAISLLTGCVTAPKENLAQKFALLNLRIDRLESEVSDLSAEVALIKASPKAGQ